MSTSQIIANRFEINDPEKDLLGRGGMGDVYRGTDTQTGQAVAIKALKPDVVASDPDIVARFIREGEALRQLNHPNIVGMVAAVEESGQHYLVLEYVEGGSLRDLLDEQKQLPIERAVEISLEVADALTRAHHLGIIHRDIKPANVLLMEDGTPRLTDFGIALVTRVDSPRLTQTGFLVGTIDYLSPEACQGEPLDSRTDIWAFGVMLYEMLTGEKPFAGDTITAKLMAILTQPVPDLSVLSPDVPDGLADLIYRMLEKDRLQRVPSVRLVGAELEAVLHEREITPPAPRPAPVVPPVRDRFATPTPPIDAPKHNLPVQPTPFVGREAELTELARLLADPGVRLLTILGAGGMGKTRLALEAGAAQLNNFERGVFFVSLAPLQSVDAIVPTVAEAIGFPFFEGGEPQQQLLDYLRRKSMFIIMDNFEHLLDGVGLVTDVLKAAPEVRILSTSRVRLNVQGEHLFHLAGMEFPDWETPEDAAQYSAVKLFLQSARRVRPGFELEADDFKYVSRICRLVQGMPLGILLAAAWVEMLTPEEIAAEIGQSLDFLETGLYDVPERQRSIRAVFDHSFNLLAEREREVFQQLSVFRGGFTREAAQRVTGASLRELMALVNRSLLHRTPTGRYQVHELTRQYAAEKLELSPVANQAARDLHCAYYTTALQGWEADLKGSRQKTVLAEMGAEIENARAAWDWAAERGQVARLDQALEGLCEFYWAHWRVHEGEVACRTAANRLAAMVSGDGPVLSPSAPLGIDSAEGLRVLARILARQADFSAMTLSHAEPVNQLLRQSLAILEGPELAGQDTRAEKAFVLLQMGSTANYLDFDYERARQMYEQSLALYQAVGDRWWTAFLLFCLALLANELGAYDEAKQLAEESLAIGRALGNPAKIADSLMILGRTTLPLGQLEEAERSLRECIAIYREAGGRGDIAVGLLYVGRALLWLGKLDEAHSLLEESLAILSDLGVRLYVLFSNLWLGYTRIHLGQYEQARTQVSASLALFREYGDQWGIGDSLFALGSVALVEGAYAEAGQLLEESVAVLRQTGRRDDIGRVLATLGYAACKLGQFPQAGRHLYEALWTAAEIRAFIPLLLALLGLALLLADRGQKEQAVELYALASSRYPLVANSRWFEDVAGRHITAAAATLPPEVVAAAQERGRARDLDATVAELLEELGGKSPRMIEIHDDERADKIERSNDCP